MNWEKNESSSFSTFSRKLTINAIVETIYGSVAIQHQPLFFGDAQAIVSVASSIPGSGYGFGVGPFGEFPFD